MDEPPENVDRQKVVDREYMLSPELLDLLKRDNANFHWNAGDWQMNDIFVMAVWCLYFLDKKMTLRTVDLDNFYIDFKAIYNEVKTIAIMINTKFADLLRGCLMVQVEERLTIDQINELVGLGEDIEEGVLNEREAKLQAIDRAFWNLESSRLREGGENNEPVRKYYYNKEVDCAEPGNVNADRHLYSWSNKNETQVIRSTNFVGNITKRSN